MFVAVAEVELYLPTANSLKAKRKVVHSLRDRIYKRLRVSISETEHHDLWQRAILGVASAHPTLADAEQSLQRIQEVFNQSVESEIVAWNPDIWSPS